MPAFYDSPRITDRADILFNYFNSVLNSGRFVEDLVFGRFDIIHLQPSISILYLYKKIALRQYIPSLYSIGIQKYP